MENSLIKAIYNKGRKSSTDKANGEVKRQKKGKIVCIHNKQLRDTQNN